MKRALIIFLIFSFLGMPFLVSAENQIDLGKLNLDKISDISKGVSGEKVLSGETFDFIKKLYSLGSKIGKLVSKVWKIANSFIEEVTGLTLSELLGKMINVAVGIIEKMIEMLDRVL